MSDDERPTSSGPPSSGPPGSGPPSTPGTTSFVLYHTPDGRSRLSVRLEGETLWLTQAQMAELFQTSKQNISLHVQNVLEDRELPEDSVVKEYLTTAADGKSYSTKHYSLDMVIAVGYRVRSGRGVQFRQWATATLAEYLTKGFAIDDVRLKEGRNWGADYFDELLARIRDIRASERRFYQKITDIYALSVDYDPNAPITREFYATVQNKLHWAITGHTAAETVVSRADATKPNMGLTTWKNAPAGPVRRADAGVAKNYLSEQEIAALNRIVTMYLDYAEDQAARQVPMHMADWIRKLDAFLAFNERNILRHAGKVSAALAEEHAAREFEKFDRQRLQREASEPSSDFDRVVERAKELGGKSEPKPKPGEKRTKGAE
ncbi:MAG: virulence RhuM family protein [Planctomycetaceae bacterium]|jgi:hypothetical protein|nr:virulence RhuM family protein [Phycisphaerales bacterium]MCE2654431.1 virulence RhuM family protein [Planctomycetaceae bacterium]